MSIVYDENVKRPGIEEEYTEDQIRELAKCTKNPKYFLENYVKVLHPDKGWVPFKLYPHQLKMLDAFENNRFCIAKCPRQSGKTSFCSGYLLHYILFNSDKTSGVVSNKAASANEILDRIKNMYESVPGWLKCGVKNYAKTYVEFENGSRIIASATSKNAFRGWTISGILLADEFAHVHRNLQDDFWSSNYPTISASKQAKIIIISTPLGMYDKFHELYIGAEKDQNNFKHIDVHWSEHPERDDDWNDEQRKILGETLWKQEVLCVDKNTYITILNTETNKIENVKIGDLYERI